MQTHVPGSPLKASFELRDDSGLILEPIALRWRVIDESETVLLDWAQAPVMLSTGIVILEVPGAVNTLLPPATRGIRNIELEATLADGSVLLRSQIVMLAAQTQLQVGVNSFGTYLQALMHAQDFTADTLVGWGSVESRQEREAALIEAHQAMRRMPIVVDNRTKLWAAGMDVTDIGGQPVSSRLFSIGVFPDDTRMLPGQRQLWVSFLKPGEYQSYVAEQQKQILMKAQLLEASAILEADQTLAMRRKGIMSTSVGESSQFFRTSKPLELPMISQKAIGLIKPYLRWSVAVGRR